MKKVFFLVILLVFFCINLLLPISVEILSFDRSNCSIVLGVRLGGDEVVSKDSIKLSISSPGVTNVKWHVLTESIEEYLSSLKLYKKILRDYFEVEVFYALRDTYDAFENEVVVELYFSCFVVTNDEKITSSLIRVPLKDFWLDKKGFFKKNEVVHIDSSKARPLGEAHVDQKYYQALRPGFWAYWIDRFDTRLLTVFVLFFMLLGYIVVSVLSIIDVLVILFLGIWFVFCRYFSWGIYLYIASAAWFFAAAIWFFKDHNPDTRFLSVTRFVLGIIFSAGVLPILLQAYLISFL